MSASVHEQTHEQTGAEPLCPYCRQEHLQRAENGRLFCPSCDDNRVRLYPAEQLEQYTGRFLPLPKIHCSWCGHGWRPAFPRDRVTKGAANFAYIDCPECEARLFVQFHPLPIQVRTMQLPPTASRAVSRFVVLNLAGHHFSAILTGEYEDGFANLTVWKSTDEAINAAVLRDYPEIKNLGVAEVFFFDAPRGSGEGCWTDDLDTLDLPTAHWRINEEYVQGAFVLHRRGEFADLVVSVPAQAETRRALLELRPKADLEAAFFPVHNARRGLDAGCWWPKSPATAQAMSAIPTLPDSLIAPIGVGDAVKSPRPRLSPLPGWTVLGPGRWQRKDGLILSKGMGSHEADVQMWVSHPDVEGDFNPRVPQEQHKGAMILAAAWLAGKSLRALTQGARVRAEVYVCGWRLSGMWNESKTSCKQIWSRPGATDDSPAHQVTALQVWTDAEGVHWHVTLPFIDDDVPEWAVVESISSEPDRALTFRARVKEAKSALTSLINQESRIDQEEVEQASKQEAAPAPHLPADPTDLPKRPALPDPSDPGLPYEVDPEGAAW